MQKLNTETRTKAKASFDGTLKFIIQCFYY